MQINPLIISAYSNSSYTPTKKRNPNSLNKGDSVSFTSSYQDGLKKRYKTPYGITPRHFETILQKIDECDDTLPNGKYQRVYEFFPYMVKSPGGLEHFTPIKEYFILDLIEQAKLGTDITPKPYYLIEYPNRAYLFEEYITGPHADTKEFIGMENIEDFLKKLTVLDQNGIVNRDIQQSNIILDDNGNYSKLVDFDRYSFLDHKGQIKHSDHTPYLYFSKLTDKKGPISAPHATLAGIKTDRNVPFIERFIASFKHGRKTPISLKDMVHFSNMPDNPYISIPSNLGSFEAGTLYKKMIDQDFSHEEGRKFLKQYRRYKGQVYHTSMKEFLESLEIPPELEAGPEELAKIQKRIKNAIEYEDFLSRIMTSRKAENYFAKFEAAKIQLSGLMEMFEQHKGGVDEKNIHSAYSDLIRIICTGLDRYKKDDDIQRYLTDELDMYTKAFEHTGFALSLPEDKLPGIYNIISVFFEDEAKDIKAFPYALYHAKENALDTVKGLKESGVTDEHTLKKAASEAAVTALDMAGGRVTKEQYKNALKDVIDYALGKRKKEKPVKKIARTVKDTFEETITSMREPKRRPVVYDEDTIREISEARVLNRLGTRNFAILGGIIAIGAYAAYKVIDYKNKRKEEERLALLTSNQDVLNNIRHDSKLDMFKKFFNIE